MLDKRRSEALERLSRRLGVTFSQLELLHQALIHTSYVNEAKKCRYNDNERLEFLGDAVLDAIVSDHLFKHYPHMPEGELTKARAAIVCEPSLARQSCLVGLGEQLMLGRGEEASGGRERVSILADAFEAVIGAIYLDMGFQGAADFVLRQFADVFEQIATGHYNNDFKTLLQETVQRGGDSNIHYQVIKAQGPDHDKLFEVAVIVNGSKMGHGIGKTKKEAEQNAAKQALESLPNG